MAEIERRRLLEITMGGEAAGVSADDAEFTKLSAAYELLGTEERRRTFDSVDLFNDDRLPSSFVADDLEPGNFYRVFGPGFDEQARFSLHQPMPNLGDADTPHAHVLDFYQKWTNFESWRDFSLTAEHDESDPQLPRDEKRRRQRENAAGIAKLKKSEGSRVQAFVQLAYHHDLRIAAAKKQAALLKAQAKEAKALNRAKAHAPVASDQPGGATAKEPAGAGTTAETDAALKAEARAAEKRERERVRSAAKKAKKEQRGEDEREKCLGPNLDQDQGEDARKAARRAAMDFF